MNGNLRAPDGRFRAVAGGVSSRFRAVFRRLSAIRSFASDVHLTDASLRVPLPLPERGGVINLIMNATWYVTLCQRYTPLHKGRAASKPGTRYNQICGQKSLQYPIQ